MTDTLFPNARRDNLLEWLRQYKRATIDDLAAQFGVSGMTIHRDLAELVKTGAVQKVHGGVVWVEQATPPAPSTDGRCEMCGVAAVRMPFTIRASQQVLTACCAHCGLMMLHGLEDVASLLTTDFLYNRTVSAKSAAYVVGSSVQICCAPSVLSFTCREDAERFSHGFGGTVMDYEQALDTLQHH
ncbi:MAG: DeoR family transcriptional regulator [Anaerolineae bacterium]|jgi:DeoR/GlpR family transcriptional regulator of sugar metabolism|nr:DeoR family transcriptional regulator [Anaerolineae bacterium]